MSRHFPVVALLFGCTVLAACARWPALASPEARAGHWRTIMPLEVPIGSQRAELQRWLAERELSHHEIDSPRSLVYEVEEIAGDGWICSVWVIQVKAVLGEDDVIDRYEVDEQGVCL